MSKLERLLKILTLLSMQKPLRQTGISKEDASKCVELVEFIGDINFLIKCFVVERNLIHGIIFFDLTKKGARVLRLLDHLCTD
jgi:hypothetical protein